MTTTQIDHLIEQHSGDRSALVAILQDVQRQEGYLPKKTLSALSEKLDVPLSRLFAMATFYRSFSLVPTGRNHVCVCMGTACHVRGAQQVLDRLENVLGVKPGVTTRDRRFTLETVRCLGCCSIGPVVRVGGETLGRVKQDKVEGILKRFQ
jgi:NADH-quinone oxidoreductase subunit E